MNKNDEIKFFLMNLRRGVLWTKRKIIISEKKLRYYSPSNFI